MNTRHVKRWKKRIFTYNNILFIASGMALILTILFLCPCAWILAVITGWIIISYLVITALGMERNEKKNGKIGRTIKRAGMLFYGKPNQH